MTDFKKKAVREKVAGDAAREAALQKGDYVAKFGSSNTIACFQEKRSADIVSPMYKKGPCPHRAQGPLVKK